MGTHKIPESERYKGFAKWVLYLLARGLVSLLQSLPISLAYKLGRGAGWLSWKLMSKRRAVVRKNLEVVNAWMEARSPNNGWRTNDGVEEKVMASIPSGMRPIESSCRAASATGDLPSNSSEENGPKHLPSISSHYSSLPREAKVKEVFQRAGANLFSGFTFSQMSPEQMEEHLQVEGLEHLKTALSKGKGAIILLSHMGPWEALAQFPSFFAVRHGIQAPLGSMYRPLNNTYLDEWIKKQREVSGARLFSRRDGFHKPVDFIRSGGMLCILADQKMREGPLASYFGLEVPTTPLPGLFHRRSGAPMLAFSLATLAPALWKLTVTPVTYPADVDLSSRAELASICNQALEQGLASSPCDGFWMHKRF